MELDLEKINDSNHLLDLLINCESILDSADIYCYKSWIDGEVVEGPIVSRYWVKISLLYPYDKMPDPRAALRLLKIGVQVEFDRMQRASDPATEAQPEAKAKPEEWLVRLSFPRRLLDQNEEVDLAVYDDEVNTDDVSDAQDGGLDTESSLHTDEQMPPGMNDPNAQPQPGQPEDPNQLPRQ